MSSRSINERGKQKEERERERAQPQPQPVSLATGGIRPVNSRPLAGSVEPAKIQKQDKSENTSNVAAIKLFKLY